MELLRFRHQMPSTASHWNFNLQVKKQIHSVVLPLCCVPDVGNCTLDDRHRSHRRKRASYYRAAAGARSWHTPSEDRNNTT